MKKYIVKVSLVLTLVCLILVSKSQTAALDIIDVKKLVVRSGTSSTAYHNLGHYISKNLLGAPGSITNKLFEIQEKQAKVYNYTGLKIYYIDDHFNSFEITNSTWSVGPQGGPYIKVGANINTVSNLLPNYAANTISGTLSAPIIQAGIITDSYLYIEFNSSNIITSLSIRTY